MSADMFGLHGIVQGQRNISDAIGRCDAFARTLGLSSVESARRPSTGTVRAYVRSGLPEIALTMEWGFNPSRTHVLVCEPVRVIAEYGPSVVADLFKGICEATRPTLARTFRGPAIAAVLEEELSGRLQSLGWWQYLSSKMARRIGRIRLLAGPFYRVEPLESGACIIWTGPAPFNDPLVPLSDEGASLSELKREAEHYLGIQPAAGSEVGSIPAIVGADDDENRMDRSEPEVFVSQERTELKEARRLAKLSREQDVQTIGSAPMPRMLSYDPLMHAAERRPAKTIALLRAVLNQTDGSEQALSREVTAVVLLWHLGAPEGRAALRDRLANGTREVKIGILHGLTSLSLWCRHRTTGYTGPQPRPHRAVIRFRSSDAADLIAACLDSGVSEVAQAVASLTTFTSIPGVAERALSLVSGGDTINTDQLLLIAAHGISSTDILDIASSRLDAISKEDEHRQQRHVLLSVLHALVHRADRAIADAAADALQRFVTRLGAAHPETQLPQQTLELRARRVDGAASLATGEDATRTLLHLAETAPAYEARCAVGALGVRAAGSRDDALVQRILDCQRQRPKDYLGVQSALLHIRGRVADHVLLDGLPNQDPTNRAQVVWALEEWTLGYVLKQCQVAGVIANAPSSYEVDAVVRECCGGYPEEKFQLFKPFVTLLGRCGAAVTIYTEHRWYPPRYDYLIRKIVTMAQPWFRIDFLSEVVHNDIEWGYTIRFIANQRVYRLELPHYTKYYSVPPVIEVLNRALADGGAHERFFLLDEVVFFGVPEALRKLSRDILLPMTDESCVVEDAIVEYLLERQRRNPPCP
jgi:hypothetical protein